MPNLTSLFLSLYPRTMDAESLYHPDYEPLDFFGDNNGYTNGFLIPGGVTGGHLGDWHTGGLDNMSKAKRKFFQVNRMRLPTVSCLLLFITILVSSAHTGYLTTPFGGWGGALPWMFVSNPANMTLVRI